MAAASPCGGNLVGSWEVKGLCTTGMTEQQLIDEYSDEFNPPSGTCGVFADIAGTGYLRFHPDGTFQIKEIDSVILGFSESCLKGIGHSCESMTRLGTENPCRLSNGTCTCSAMVLTILQVGSYTTPDTSYQLYDNFGLYEVYRDYCVQGDVLNVFAPSETIGGGGISIAVRIDDGGGVNGDASVSPPKSDASLADVRPDVSVDRPNVDIAMEHPVVEVLAVNESRDAGVDATNDSLTIDTTPLPLDALAPSTAASCRLAATVPCGGDITGDWTIAGICDPWLSETELVGQIKATCNTQADWTTIGPAVFNGDGTCVVDQTTIYKTDYPVTCLAKGGDTCSAKDQRYKNAIGTKEVVAASCILVSDDLCRCEDDYRPSGTSCTYSVSGDRLTFISPPDTAAAGAYDYCVRGDVLSIFVAPTSIVGAACDTCLASYVLIRPH
jgi:hypothetical protein